MQILEFDLIADSIQLNRLDNSGNPISYLGKLHDDGLNGDETAGDSIFSTRVNLQEPQETSILLGASAAFGVPPYIIKSPPTIIDVKPNILLNTPLAKYNRQRIIFTDLQGKNISEIPVIQETQTIKNGDNSVFTVTEEKPIISLNQRYVGILKTQTLSLDIPGDESENDMQLAQEFRYMDASGTLWTKNPEGTGRNFYIPEYSPIISADGERVLLLEVSEGDNDPKLSVYTASGLRIFNEILEFSVITEAKMSKNGRYVFLRGEPKSSQKGGVTLSIIDIDNPINRWSNSFSGFSTKSERYIENTAGGFDVWINDVMIASFPN
jgi:hypothetical protein